MSWRYYFASALSYISLLPLFLHDSSFFSFFPFFVPPFGLLVVLTFIFFVLFFFHQFLWTISIYLEAVAIVPQLIVLQRYREVENLTGHYVFLLGAYRALYIVNWVYRSYHETYYKHNWVVYICGIVQTCLYVDFFYYYVLRLVNSSFDFIHVSNHQSLIISSPFLLLLFRSPFFFLFSFLRVVQQISRR